MNKKTKKTVLITISVIVFTSLAIMITLYVSLKDFKILESGEIIKDIYTIKGNTANMYLVKLHSGDYIAFDAADDPNAIQQDLIKLKIDPNKVTAIFLTHTDYDHVCGLKIFNKAKIYISEQEEQMINGKTKRSLFSSNSTLPAPYIKLNDNEIIKFGSTKVMAIASYGHTPGSFSYLVNGSILFTGDNLLLKDNKVTTFVRLFTMDMETQKISIKKLAGFANVRYAFTAHSGYTDNFQEAIKEWK